MKINRKNDGSDDDGVARDAFGIPLEISEEMAAKARAIDREIDQAADRASEAEDLRRQFREQMNSGEALTNLAGSADLEMVESAVAVNEMYRSYLAAGFERGEALWLVSATMSGGPRLPAYIEDLLRP